MKLSANETNLILTDNQKVYLYNTDGNKLSEININYIVTDLCLESNNLFVLNSDNNQLLKYQITNNNLTTTAQTITNESLKFYSSITIDNNTGIIYLFDNNSCKIDRLINPTFNFKQNIGTYQVNNKSVCVYQRPYFLNGLDTPNVVKTLTLNDRVEIFSKTSISYGNIDYYIILLENNSFGYINKNDLTYLSTIINYEAILPNATLKSYDSSQVINIYSNASTDSEVIAVADTDTRVFVEKYSEDEKFAYIKYYDKNQNLVMGYVSTSSLKLDALSTMQIIALSLIGASIILIIAILITTKIVKKSRLKKLSQE